MFACHYASIYRQISLKLSIYRKRDQCKNCLYRPWAPCRHILLNKYDCHIAYTSHTSNIVNGYIHPTFLQICAKTQPTAIHTSHVIAKYVLETNVSTKLSIDALYAKYLIDLCGRCLYIYVPYMKSPKSTMWQWALYTYLTYITEQIWLPHCTYMFHCTATVVHV